MHISGTGVLKVSGGIQRYLRGQAPGLTAQAVIS